jgi:hypothetical protein
MNILDKDGNPIKQDKPIEEIDKAAPLKRLFAVPENATVKQHSNYRLPVDNDNPDYYYHYPKSWARPKV